ncbi:MAG: hypothetical protein KatS3mg019_2122 [Fimbriimonadales bacterium]|nr:MAG: hypothetical protein KatS3mg019_2122 [Fimbriimonadales bacterium]
MRRFHIGAPEWSPPRVPLQLPLGFGSLGWLAHLIRKHKLDLLEIDLAPVAQACYDYWREAGDMDEAADALATLAYLTERKAQRLLAPEPEPEPEPDEPLEPTRLPVSYLPVVEWLRQREGEQMQLFFRGGVIDPREYELPPEFGAELPDQLWLAFKRLLERRMPPPAAIPHRRYFSLHARMIEIRERILQTQAAMPFDALAEEALDIIDLLVSFLATLELWRLGQVDLSIDSAGVVWLIAEMRE